MSETKVDSGKPSGPFPKTQTSKQPPGKQPKGVRPWKPKRGPRRPLPDSIVVSGDLRDGNVFFSHLPKRFFFDLAFTIGPKYVCILVVCSKAMRSQFGNPALWYELASTLPVISKALIKYEIVLQRPPRIPSAEPKAPVPVLTAITSEESKDKKADSKQKAPTKTDDKAKPDTKTENKKSEDKKTEDKKTDDKKVDSKDKAEEGEGKTAEKPIDAEGLAKLIKQSIPKYVNVKSLTTNHVLRKDVLSSWEGFAALNSLYKLQLRGGFHIFAGDLPRGRERNKPKIPQKVYTEEKSVIESYAWLNVLNDLLSGKHEVQIPFGGGVITRIGRGGTILKFSVKPESKDNAEKGENQPRVFYFFFDDFALSFIEEAKALHDLLTEYVNMLKVKATEKERERAEKNKNKPSPNVNQNQKKKKKNAKPKVVTQREDPVAKYLEIKGLIEKHISKEKLSAGLVNAQSLLVKPGSIPFANLEARLKDQTEHKAKVNKQAEKEYQGMTEFLLDSLDEESFISKTPKSLIERQKREEDRYLSSINAANNAKNPNSQEEPVKKENKAPREKKPPKLIKGEDGTMTVPSKNRGTKKPAKKAAKYRNDAEDHGVYTLNPYDVDAQQKLQQKQIMATEAAKEAARLLKPKVPAAKKQPKKQPPKKGKKKPPSAPAAAPVKSTPPVAQSHAAEQSRNVPVNANRKSTDNESASAPAPVPVKSAPNARMKKQPKVSKVKADALKYASSKTKEETDRLVRKAKSKKSRKPSKKEWYNNPEYLTMGMVALGIVIILSIISYGTQSS
eukprot:TRINITY_DN993_c0_g1_i5.p1 TRINITY_DN993_c0_g1~~TRINITY_DN993_c0_g1_i5.p1  ORF type:complete len:788 (+),score=225.09 TRINITY_DN993_c0_g1_i5:82-2445(+)